MTLVSLEAAKRHLKILDPAQDAEVMQVLEGASAALVRHLAADGDPAWDATTTPKEVQHAVLLLLDHYWWHRGGDLHAGEADDATRQVWDAIDALLATRRVPGLA